MSNFCCEIAQVANSNNNAMLILCFMLSDCHVNMSQKFICPYPLIEGFMEAFEPLELLELVEPFEPPITVLPTSSVRLSPPAAA